MGKIPVGQTIRHAYGVTVQNFSRLVIILWLPFAALLAVLILQSIALDDLYPHLLMGESAAVGQTWQILFPAVLASYVIASVMMTGIAEQFLDLRPAPRFAYFSLGKSVWRLTGALVIALLVLLVVLTIIIVLAVFAAIFVTKVTGVSPENPPTGTTEVLIGVLFMVGICATLLGMLYLFLRQFFFLVPVINLERHMGLRRAWQLSKGNFWRIVLVTLAIAVPGLIFTGLLVATGIVATDHGGTVQELIAQRALATARLKDNAFWAVPAYFLVTVFTYGALVGAQVFAYRHLIGGNSGDVR